MNENKSPGKQKFCHFQQNSILTFVIGNILFEIIRGSMHESPVEIWDNGGPRRLLVSNPDFLVHKWDCSKNNNDVTFQKDDLC